MYTDIQRLMRADLEAAALYDLLTKYEPLICSGPCADWLRLRAGVRVYSSSLSTGRMVTIHARLVCRHCRWAWELSRIPDPFSRVVDEPLAIEMHRELARSVAAELPAASA